MYSNRAVMSIGNLQLDVLQQVGVEGEVRRGGLLDANEREPDLGGDHVRARQALVCAGARQATVTALLANPRPTNYYQLR